MRWLPVAEFATNSAPSATTGISSFHAVYGYEPRMDFDIPAGELGPPTHDPSKPPAQSLVEALAMTLKESWSDLKEAIRVSQVWVSSRENKKCRDPILATGDLAYLDTRHLSRGRPTSKLDYRWTGPYRV